MKFSIIVPVYNVEGYIRNCIDKLLAQSYSDYEIILVNDGSTDKSRQICLEYAEKHPDKIRLYDTPNGGPGAGRNCGINHASGDFVMFVDSDDELMESAIEDIYVKLMEKVPKDAAENIMDYFPDILIYDFCEVEENGNVLGTHSLDNLYQETIHAEKNLAADTFNLSDFKTLLFYNPCCWNKVYKKSLFEDGKNRFPEKVWYEDLRFVLKILQSADSMAYLDRPLYLYYKRLGSIMNNSNIDRNVQIIDALEDIKKHFDGTEYMREIEYVAIERGLVDASGRILSAGLNKKLLDKIRGYVVESFPDYRKNPYLYRLSKKQRFIYRLVNMRMYVLLRIVFVVNHLLTGKRVKDRTER